MLLSNADKIMVIGNSENLRVFNFAILLKSRKFDAHEIYVLQYILEVICIWILIKDFKDSSVLQYGTFHSPQFGHISEKTVSILMKILLQM